MGGVELGLLQIPNYKSIMPEKNKEIPLDQKFLNGPSVELARRLGYQYGGLTAIEEERKEFVKSILYSNEDYFEAFIDGAAQRRIEDSEKQKANKEA
jgi:hypothetical protein